MVKSLIIVCLGCLLFSCSSPGPRLYPQSFDSGKKSFEKAKPQMAIHWFEQALTEAHKKDNTKWEYRALQDLFYIHTLIEAVQENSKYSASLDYQKQLSTNKWDTPQKKHSRQAQSNFLKQSCDYKQSQALEFTSLFKDFSIALCSKQFANDIQVEVSPKNKGLSAWIQGRYKLLQNKGSEAIPHLDLALRESKLKSRWLQRSLILKDLSKAYAKTDLKKSTRYLERATKQIEALEL